MGLLLLLTSTLLSSYVCPGRAANATQLFTIKEINLSIEPSADVTRDTNVILRCKAFVSSSGQEELSLEYTLYKDNNIVVTRNKSSSEDFTYPLPRAKVSNSGKYKCNIKVKDKDMTSEAKKLTVTGLSKPQLRLNQVEISEGEELRATCTAPDETGSIFFYFYEDSREIMEKQVDVNRAEAKLRLSSKGIHKIHCTYTVLLTPDSFKSENSNVETVSVEELPISAVLKIDPQQRIYEGDQLSISCTTNNSMHIRERVVLYLSQGERLLSVGEGSVSHSTVALAKEPAEFECELKMGNIVKRAKQRVSVTELFSAPTITMSPDEVFQKESVTLTCKSERYASEKLHKDELTYSLDNHDSDDGIFFVEAVEDEFNYTCTARARGVVKQSRILTVRPKAYVSAPDIFLDSKAILGQPIKIHCLSESGSLPINYTLMKNNHYLSSVIISLPSQEAVFTVNITRTDEINEYTCQAKNSHKEPLSSERLHASVIEPLKDPVLLVVPPLKEIFEGVDLYLICRVLGTPPITFKWYRKGYGPPLHTTTSEKNNSFYHIPSVSKSHSATYYCEAVNHANNVVHTDMVHVQVGLAVWKQGLIGGFALLVVSGLLVVVGVLYFLSKRGKKEAASELSVKPSSPKSDDSLTVNLTSDKEVYDAVTGRVNKAAVSVWSKPPPEADVVSDEESSMVSKEEPDVEYTEVVHSRPVDPARVPLRKGTDTVYSELQNSPRGAADHHDYGSVDYAEVNGEQPESNHYHAEVNKYQDLPLPVD